MKTLRNLTERISLLEWQGNLDAQVSSIQFDSRKVADQCLFVATRGTLHDGHTFIPKAVESGAVAILCEQLPEILYPQITYLRVSDASKALGELASAWYDHPSSSLSVIAVTGTNGKTTNVTLLYNVFRHLGYKVGMLSTVHNLINDEVIESTHTTPDALQIQALMRKMVDQGCTHCFMEASSHAIHQNRMAGIWIHGALFTNISRDHLDYHITMDNYIAAKKKLFDDLPASSFALANADDKRGTVMLQNTKASKHYFSIKNFAEFKAKVLANTLTGMELEIEHTQIWCRLVGEFNAYNVLGVYAATVLLGVPSLDALTALSVVSGAKGRFETLVSESGIICIIDYAHTPDALDNVLHTIRDLRTHNEKVITVVGCGGNRDQGKRPLMAKSACKLSDMCIFTSDNPRHEDPEAILDQMMAGVAPLHFKKVMRVVDRKAAIAKALDLCAKGDIVLVAGKGHETYQEISGIKHPFDDRAIVLELLEKIKK